jgi:hypothetical protein
MEVEMKSLLASLVLALLILAVPAFPQQTKPGMMKEDMMASCKAMMEKHKEMQGKMAQMDQKLNDLVKKMNDAKGNDKVEAMAAVLNELVDQRMGMHQMMSGHHAMMMKHMGEHMQKGATSMMQCPMMNQMKKEETDEHKEHHAEEQSEKSQ